MRCRRAQHSYLSEWPLSLLGVSLASGDPDAEMSKFGGPLIKETLRDSPRDISTRKRM